MDKIKKSFSKIFGLLKDAWEYGSVGTKLSFFILGAGNIARKQIIKGLIYLAMEIGFIFYMAVYGVTALSHFGDLGTNEPHREINAAGTAYVQIPGDNSMLMLLAAAVAIFVIVLFKIMWYKNIKSAYSAQLLDEQG